MVGTEGVVERSPQEGVNGQVVEHPGLGEHGVHPLGAEALEVVAARGCSRQQLAQCRHAALDVTPGEQALDQRVPVLVQRGGHLGDRGVGPEPEQRHRRER